MFMDEAGFGRISEPSYCWSFGGIRPSVPCHRIREFVYAFGAVDPIDGAKSFIIAPKCNTAWTNAFLEVLSAQFQNDYILLVADCAGWHKSNALIIPANIEITHIPPYTPEMNPIEQIWREIRSVGFKNTLFNSLNNVIDRLCIAINGLSQHTVISISQRAWIMDMF